MQNLTEIFGRKQIKLKLFLKSYEIIKIFTNKLIKISFENFRIKF